MTKNNPGKYDCYANAEPDEPMFVLLARDRHAPALVALWAVLRELDDKDQEKVKEARQVVLDMMDWGSTRGKQYVGFGQTTLAGILELIRCANQVATSDTFKNTPTTDDVVRRLLSLTKMEDK